VATTKSHIHTLRWSCVQRERGAVRLILHPPLGSSWIQCESRTRSSEARDTEHRRMSSVWASWSGIRLCTGRLTTRSAACPGRPVSSGKV